MFVGSIGEFRLIERFRRQIKLDSSVIKGSGDDCAVMAFDKGNYLLFTCDMIIENIDFTRHDPAHLIGRKALAISLSDIAACAGIPRYALVSLGIPRITSLRFIDRVFAGMNALAKEYKVNLVGGDISKSKELIIDVSMIGCVEKSRLVLRSGARVGDAIFVSAPLGGSIKGKHLTFKPRLREARFLAGHFKINSMIDISDGLAQDLGHLARASEVGAVLFENAIPLAKHSCGLKDALFAGEDFELLFTLSQKESKSLLSQSKYHFYCIGKIVRKKWGVTLSAKDGTQHIIPAKGFKHF